MGVGTERRHVTTIAHPCDPMRNTYNISLLRKRIHDALPRPATPAGDAAIEGFLAMPGASAWRPLQLGLRELSFVFDVGVPFALIGPNASARALGARVGDAVRDGRPPDAAVARVVHVGALLTHWGWRVEFAAERDVSHVSAQHADGAVHDVAVVHALDASTASLHDLSSDSSRLILVEAAGAHERVAEGFADALASSSVAAVITFEPRFWIGIEQKEWLYLARPNRHARVALPDTAFGNAPCVRNALRIPLLI